MEDNNFVNEMLNIICVCYLVLCFIDNLARINGATILFGNYSCYICLDGIAVKI